MTTYGAQQVTYYQERENESFHSLMSLLRENGITDNATTQEIIRLWVTGTQSSETVGWHKGYASAKD